jgi:glycosyltransferase involved in cell wall biosynthesis
MFSVIIPVYNHAAFLKQAVWSALRSPLVTEVLLLDDGSRDGSAQLAAELAAREARIRNLTPRDGGNRGAHNRLNELVGAACSSWIAVLNSDDTFFAGRFERMAAEAAFPESDFIFGNLLLMNEAGRLIGAKRGPFDTSTPFPPSFDIKAMVAAGQFLELLSHQNYLGTTSNIVFRKDLHARVGGFRNYRYVHDWDFALRAMALGRPLYVQRYVTAYRYHSGNTIRESATNISLEAQEVFDRFIADFPEIAGRPAFRHGLECNKEAPLMVRAVRA